ncbi:MAG: ATP-binding cassette domain-containing protein [Candidatus Methanofastidiosa archaeon]|nr:ATP-binding cassette domain-containing protein [Candidatus Methanofastidiosa archaeon]
MKSGDDIAIKTNDLTKIFLRRNSLMSRLKKKKKIEVRAVDGIDLEVHERELFGLLGPNGAGKTSLIKLLSTLLLPDKGTASVNGWDIEKNSFEVRMSIGLTLSSERQLYWKLSAQENLEYFASLYLLRPSEIRQRVEDTLELLGIADQRDMLIENFSSGNRQKVALARALLNDPPILFLDEPTIGLDPSFSKGFRKLIKDRINKSESKTILLTTHYMDEADQLCNRIAFINEGRIVALDTPRNLKRSIDEKEIITLNLTKASDAMVSELERLEPIHSIERYVQDDSNFMKIYTDSASSCIQDIFGILIKHGSHATYYRTSKPTLEDVFIKITGSGLDG